MNQEAGAHNTAQDKRLEASKDEIARYNALAELWWDEQGPMWPLHRLNQLRAPFVLSVVREAFGIDEASPQDLAGKSVLDIGCGAGLMSEALASAGARVTGVDAAENNINIARDHARASHGL